MDKFFIREIVAVWAFNQQNEAVWKCGSVGKLKITQDGTTVRKRDSAGCTIFRMDTAKSASISFEVPYWDFNILSLLSGAEIKELDGTENPYLIEPIKVPYAESRELTVEDISDGYIYLDENPHQYENGSHELALHKTNRGDAILQTYQEFSTADDKHFTIEGNILHLPTSLSVGDMIETVYEFDSLTGIELVNTSDGIPQTYKVRILMLISPICDTDIVEAVWITARNATPDIALSLDFGVEDNIPISLELGYTICDTEKKLYEIVSLGKPQVDEGEPLRTYDDEILYTYDDDSVRTIN